MKRIFLSAILPVALVFSMVLYQGYTLARDQGSKPVPPAVSLEKGVTADIPVSEEISRILDAKLEKNEKRLYELYPEVFDTQAFLTQLESDSAIHNHDQLEVSNMKEVLRGNIDALFNEIGNLRRSNDNITLLNSEIKRRIEGGEEAIIARARPDAP